MNETAEAIFLEEFSNSTTEFSKQLLKFAGLPVLGLSGVLLSGLWCIYIFKRMKVARQEYQKVKRNSADHMNYDRITKNYRIMSVYYSFMMMICLSEVFCNALTFLIGFLFLKKPHVYPSWNETTGDYDCIAHILLDIKMRAIYYSIPMHIQVTLYLTILGLVRMIIYYLRDSYRNERSFGWSYFKLYGLFMSGRIMTYFFFAGVLQTLPFAIIWFTVFIIYESICIVHGCVGLQRILRLRYDLALKDELQDEIPQWRWKYIKFSLFNPVLNICLTLFSITEFLFVYGFLFAMVVNTRCWIQVAFGTEYDFYLMDHQSRYKLVLAYQIMYNLVADFAYISTSLLLGIPFALYSFFFGFNLVLRAWNKKRLYGDNSWMAQRLLNAPLKERKPKELFP